MPRAKGLVNEGQVFEWTPAGPATAEQAKAMKPKPPARKRKAKSGKSALQTNTDKAVSKAEADIATLEAELEKGTCNG